MHNVQTRNVQSLTKPPYGRVRINSLLINLADKLFDKLMTDLSILSNIIWLSNYGIWIYWHTDSNADSNAN